MAAVLCDEDVDVEVAPGLRLLGFDAVSVRELGLLGASDERILEAATASGRVVFTHNTHDFPSTAERWTADGREYPGVLVSVRYPVGVLVGRLAAWLGDDVAVSAISNSWGWLPGTREVRDLR